MLRSSPCANGPPALPPPRRAHLVPPRPTGLVIVTERTGRRLDETRGTVIASVLQEVGFSTLQIGLLKRQAELTDLIEPAELRRLEIQADKWGRVHVSRVCSQSMKSGHAICKHSSIIRLRSMTWRGAVHSGWNMVIS